MRSLIFGLLALTLLAWGVSFTPAESVNILWLIRQETLNLTGFLSLAFMSLAMFLAIRPKWLEKPLGGLDRMYRAHKWAGILALGFALMHWVSKEVVGTILKSTIGRAGKVPKDSFSGIFEVLRHNAKDIGEWAFYIFVVLLVLALWKRFPYKPWRLLHKVMPVIFLALAFHGVMFVPLYYWTTPMGALLAVLFALGIYASIVTIIGQIGKKQRYQGIVKALHQPSNNVLSLRVQLEKPWQHSAGQFAFVQFSNLEGAHPFTIASAPRADNCVDFHIKALGDFTDTLASTIKVGQSVQIEGPYGQFKLDRINSKSQQVWIAGGIGVTPFLAWLEAMQQQPNNRPQAVLHYCTQDREHDPFVAKLQNLTATLDNIELHIYSSKHGEILDVNQLKLSPKQTADLWFCGPMGLANKLRTELKQKAQPVHFHQELFEMR